MSESPDDSQASHGPTASGPLGNGFTRGVMAVLALGIAGAVGYTQLKRHPAPRPVHSPATGSAHATPPGTHPGTPLGTPSGTPTELPAYTGFPPHTIANPLFPPPTPDTSDGGRHPTPAEVSQAINPTYPVALGCVHGVHGVVVHFTFAPAGTVSGLRFDGTTIDETTRTCITQALNRAHVAPFTGQAHEVHLSF